jgi:hypothetical protein
LATFGHPLKYHRLWGPGTRDKNYLDGDGEEEDSDEELIEIEKMMRANNNSRPGGGGGGARIDMRAVTQFLAGMQTLEPGDAPPRVNCAQQ